MPRGLTTTQRSSVAGQRILSLEFPKNLNEELNCSAAPGGNYDPVKFLAGFFSKPILMLALFSDHGGFISRSTALELFFPGRRRGQHSDIDIYMPAVYEAIVDSVQVLNHAGVRWNSLVRQRAEEVE